MIQRALRVVYISMYTDTLQKNFVRKCEALQSLSDCNVSAKFATQNSLLCSRVQDHKGSQPNYSTVVRIIKKYMCI